MRLSRDASAEELLRLTAPDETHPEFASLFVAWAMVTAGDAGAITCPTAGDFSACLG